MDISIPVIESKSFDLAGVEDVKVVFRHPTNQELINLVSVGANIPSAAEKVFFSCFERFDCKGGKKFTINKKDATKEDLAHPFFSETYSEVIGWFLEVYNSGGVEKN